MRESADSYKEGEKQRVEDTKVISPIPIPLSPLFFHITITVTVSIFDFVAGLGGFRVLYCTYSQAMEIGVGVIWGLEMH